MSTLNRNLISVGQLAESRLKTTFSVDSWKVTKGAFVIVQGTKDVILYVVSCYNGLVVRRLRMWAVTSDIVGWDT